VRGEGMGGLTISKFPAKEQQRLGPWISQRRINLSGLVTAMASNPMKAHGFGGDYLAHTGILHVENTSR
jgi:hypothetical protein